MTRSAESTFPAMHVDALCTRARAPRQVLLSPLARHPIFRLQRPTSPCSIIQYPRPSPSFSFFFFFPSKFRPYFIQPIQRTPFLQGDDPSLLPPLHVFPLGDGLSKRSPRGEARRLPAPLADLPPPSARSSTSPSMTTIHMPHMGLFLNHLTYPSREAKPGRAKSSQAEPNQKPGRAKSSQAEPTQVRPSQARLSRATTDTRLRQRSAEENT